MTFLTRLSETTRVTGARKTYFAREEPAEVYTRGRAGPKRTEMLRIG